MTLVIAPATREDPALAALLASAVEELITRYPSEAQDHPLDPLAEFLMATVDGEPAGCIARVFYPAGLVEMKRVFVRAAFRGRGIGRALVQAFEDAARAAGEVHIRLETGTRQPEAVAMYEKLGYTRIENFGQYAGSPLLICLGKAL